MFVFNRCGSYNPDFPFVPFERSYDLILLSNIDLQTQCGAVIDTTIGFKGIVVYRQAADNLPTDFICFDLACTSEECHYANAIEAKSFEIFATCPVCQTKYDLLSFGWAVSKGGDVLNKTNVLQQYKTDFVNGRFVYVENQ